jgi:hypothetical protein
MIVHSAWVLVLSHKFVLFELDLLLFSLLVALKSGKTDYLIIEPEFLDTRNLGYLEFWITVLKTRITRLKISGNLERRD